MSYEKAPKLPLPDKLVLPDGRIVETRGLVNTVKNRATHNLLKKRTYNQIPKVYKQQERYTVNLKYSIEERIWQSKASLDDMEIKYNITTKQATQLRWQATNIVKYLKEHDALPK